MPILTVRVSNNNIDKFKTEITELDGIVKYEYKGDEHTTYTVELDAAGIDKVIDNMQGYKHK